MPSAAFADLQQGDAVSLAFAMLVLQPRDDVFARGNPDDTMRRVVGGPMLLLELRNRPHNGADSRAGFGLHDHLVARIEARIAGKVSGQEGLRASDGGELDRNEPAGTGNAHGAPSIYER